jgi:hypothetical protein
VPPTRAALVFWQILAGIDESCVTANGALSYFQHKSCYEKPAATQTEHVKLSHYYLQYPDANGV